MVKDKKKKDDNPLVQARHESSVLFSLKDLGSAMETEDGAADGSPGYGSAENEASGFINLGAIAKSSEYVRGGEGSQTQEPYGGVPTMVPMVTRKSNTMLIVAISVGGLLLVGVLGVLVVLLLNQNNQPTTIIQTAPPTNPAVAAIGTSPTAPDGKPAVAPAKEEEPEADGDGAKDEEGETAEGEGDGKAEGDETGEGAEDKPDEKDAVAAKDDKGNKKDKQDKVLDKKDKAVKPPKAPVADKTPPKDPPADKPPKVNKPSGGSVDSIIDGIAGKTTTPTEKAAPSGDKLTRSDIKNTVGSYMGRVRGCGGPGKSGSVKVRFTIQTDGRVSGAAVQGDKNGTAEGSCVAGIVRTMQFPKSGASMTVTYPFPLP